MSDLLMVTEIDDLHRRVDKIEKQNNEEVLALVEILSNATFFGEIKKSNCEYAKNGQCGFFVLDGEDKNKIPIITECRIKECKEPYDSLSYRNYQIFPALSAKE